MARGTKTTRTTLSVRLADQTYRDLSVYAAENLMSLNHILVTVIEEWWDKQPQKALYARRRETEEAMPISIPLRRRQTRRPRGRTT